MNSTSTEASRTSRKKGFAYGWLLVGSAMILQAVVFCVATNIHPQFTSYVVAGEGFKLSSFSLMFTIGMIISAVASPFIGKTYNKFPIKMIFIVGIIVSMGGVMFLSIANQYWMFYLGYTFGQLGIAAVTSLGAPILINSWFGEQLRGRALGLTFAGGSIGNVVLQSVVVRLLSDATKGYKFAYFWLGLFAMVVGLIVAILFVRMPKDKSEILGSSAPTDANESKDIEKWGYTLNEVKSIKYYWLYCLGFVFVGFYVAGLAFNFPTYLNALEISPTEQPHNVQTAQKRLPPGRKYRILSGVAKRKRRHSSL